MNSEKNPETKERLIKSERNPDTKSRHVYLTDEQWSKVYFIGRLIEKEKGLPPYTLSRQAAFQVMVDALPSPPPDWHKDQHISEIDFEGVALRGFMTAPEPAAHPLAPSPQKGSKFSPKAGSQKVMKKKSAPEQP